MSAELRQPCLLLRVGKQLCALPLEHVDETMRPQPVRALPQAPPFVQGVAMIRGLPVPVVSAALMLGEDGPSHPATRFVSVRAAGRRVALAVDDVLGIAEVDSDALADLPPLLGAAGERVVSTIGALDRELLLVLRSARFIPDDVWTTIDEGHDR